MQRDKIEELFELYGDDVYRLALSYLMSRADAEDVCQNVFLKLSDSRICIDNGKEKAYLLTCTANTCKNHLRSFWHRRVGSIEDSMPDCSAPDCALWEAVSSLPQKYRAVIHLYYFEGYTQKETGDILGISLTAVQTRMSRARNLLKKELSEDERTIYKHDVTGKDV